MNKFSWHIDKSIVALLKTMKSEYVNDTLTKGRLFFNFPEAFADKSLNLAQVDIHDSYQKMNILKPMVFPIVSEDESGIHYGNGISLGETARLNLISNSNKHRPICCFRSIKREDLVIGDKILYALGDISKRIETEFGHDAFVLIWRPVEFLKRLNKKTLFLAHDVYYGIDNQDFLKFMDDMKVEQSAMFQKDEKYAWQKEYRIVLPPQRNNGGFPIDIGSIEDIAIAGDIKLLNAGLLFDNSK